ERAERSLPPGPPAPVPPSGPPRSRTRPSRGTQRRSAEQPSPLTRAFEAGDRPELLPVFLRSHRRQRSRQAPSRCWPNPNDDWPAGTQRETAPRRLSRQRERTPEDPALVNFCGLAIRVQRSSDQPCWIPDLLCALKSGVSAPCTSTDFLSCEFSGSRCDVTELYSANLQVRHVVCGQLRRTRYRTRVACHDAWSSGTIRRISDLGKGLFVML